MPTRILQNRFTQGEFSPEMLGRSDTEQYYGAAETLTNVEVLPQGGLKRRPGVHYWDEETLEQASGDITDNVSFSAPNGGTGGNAQDYDMSTEFLTTSNLTTTNPYVVIQGSYTPLGGGDTTFPVIDLCGVKLTSSGSSTNDFKIQISTDAAPTTWIDVSTISLIDTTRRSYRVYPSQDFENWRLVKTTSTDLGTNKVSLLNFMPYTNKTYSGSAQMFDFTAEDGDAYAVVLTEDTITIISDLGTVAHTGNAVIPAPGLSPGTADWAQSADTAILTEKTVPPLKLVRLSDQTTNPDLWSLAPIEFDNKPKYDFTPTATNPSGTITPSATTGVITLTASATPFTNAATDEGQIIDGGGGRARIIQFLTTATVKAIVLIPFYDTTAIASGSWVYEGGYEDAWSASRGWPRCCTFHDGRLWLGGSTSLAQTLWGSKVGLFFDFDIGQISDDDAINVTLNTDKGVTILNLFSQRTLQIFTDRAEFAVFQSSGTAITPTNIDIRRQTQEGIKEGIRPVSIEGGTVYVNNSGSAIMEFLFNDVEQAYSSKQITLASSHLLSTPVGMAVESSTSENEADTLYVVNNDGTVVIGSILRNQGVLAFSKMENTANGMSVKAMVKVDSGVFLVVEGSGDFISGVYKLDADYFMDGGEIYDGTNPYDRETAFNGKTISITTNGQEYLASYTIPDGTETGSITAFADYSATVSGTVLATSASHGLVTNQRVDISGTTNYNNNNIIIKVVDANTFYFTDTWVTDDATGTWQADDGIIPMADPWDDDSTGHWGFKSTVTVKDLPVEVFATTVRSGGAFGKKKRINNVTLRLKSTSSMTVNGNSVTTPDWTASGNGADIANFTGVVQVDGILDYDETGQVTISQTKGEPFTLLALSKEVNF